MFYDIKELSKRYCEYELGWMDALNEDENLIVVVCGAVEFA